MENNSQLTHNYRQIISGFERIQEVDLNNRSNVLAGIIQTNGIDLKTAKVIVLASGTKNIDAESLSPDALPDTHAEVVARRALMFYFYQQLELFLSSCMFSIRFKFFIQFIYIWIQMHLFRWYSFSKIA